MGLGRICLLAFFSHMTGAILDITLMANVMSPSHTSFYLSCVTGERNVSLHIDRDNKIVMTHPKSKFQMYKNRSNEVQMRGFSWVDLVGIMFCLGQTQTEQTRVVYVHNNMNANLVPEKVTQTVSLSQSAELVAKIKHEKNTDILWKRNGTYYQTTDRGEVRENQFTLALPSVSVADGGIYSATFIGDSPLSSASFKLIVRGCAAKKWGSLCDKDCPDCLNGGICHHVVGECICPPGFMGIRCEKACKEGRFGRNCQEQCHGEQGCRGLAFCLPDPYGCSCAAGWSGSQCESACHRGKYGPDCALECHCQNGGTCNRFSGCICPSGWHGQHCEKSDRIPQIINLASHLEFNLGSQPVLTCKATGNPAPVHNSIDLRKADGIVFSPNKTIMEKDVTTCEFQVPPLVLSDTGFWECRVSTTGGQDSGKFKVTVKVPPVPLNPPKLLAKQSRQLVISPVDSISGDGPIISIKVLYKPSDDTSRWSSIVVDNAQNITLMNLRPVTAYLVKVQLTRPGDGGEGATGPQAVMVTECQEPTAKPVIEGSFVEGRNTLRVTWNFPSSNSVATGFLVRLYDSAKKVVQQENVSSVIVQSTYLTNLAFNKDYSLEVLAYHCASLGPPSDPLSVRLHSKGPSSPQSLSVEHVADSAIRLRWDPPEYPNGGITKYIVEVQQLGGASEPQWVDTDNGRQTSKIIMGLNASMSYQFRVRANSHVPGEWSQLVKAEILGEGALSQVPTLESKNLPLANLDQQLLLAIVGSVCVTCLTILFALLALFLIKKNFFHRRRTFTYQSGSGEETILQFNSGTLTLTRRPKPQPEPISYPILEWEDIKFEDMIGEGNFGQVIRAMIKKDGLRMNAAIKMLKEFASENDHRDFAGELEVLCKLGHHPNIINLLGACENKGYLYIAIEYAPYGNLLDFLRKSRVLETDPAFAREHGTASTLTSQQLLQFASDVAKGMQYLSEKQFIHRDLAARNILVGENLTCKIADFGLSRGEEVYVKKTMGRLPVRWMAIESLNYSVYTTKSDVWSFGVLLWEIVSLGGTPYCGMTCAELYEKLPQGYRMEKPLNCDDEVYELMRQCWRDRPYERPPFAQISVQLVRMLEARKAYVNMALFENFTYAGIDATAEEA
ncbi:tyrosine-protein kinase receptor Tie-1 isoform X2 [Hemicordylus capensis]|uniref:tyrosine-protein kinase receptor Tie-1 isoform X2 n=2 Tax=Hemicordylus capensis TaxID=884348 RepID=UPI0023027F8F|nr:tyrosine-protein kinase receptor Tie-1 isoform X2 [Hemicordylus capensis]